MQPLLHTLVALLGLLVASLGVRSMTPWPVGLGLRAKMEFLEQHSDEYDALFIGSSRVFRGIMPRVIEAQLQQDGFEFKAFNLGIAAMQDFETNHLIHAALSLSNRRLRFVFVESGRWDLEEETEAAGQTRRTVEWHTLRNARAIAEGILISERSPLEKLTSAHRHLAMCAQRLVSFGRGREIWRSFAHSAFPAFEREDSVLSESELIADAGWQSLSDHHAPLNPGDWKRLVAKIKKNEQRGIGAGKAVLAKLPMRTIGRQIEFIQSKLPALTYLTLPNSKGTTFARAMNSLGILPDYLSFDSPTRYPNLYALDRRIDANHLNRLGATELSQLLAQAIGQRLREGKHSANSTRRDPH